MSAVFSHDIRATHKNGRKIRPLIWTNERDAVRARAEFRRIQAEHPEYRFALIQRRWSGAEVTLP